MTDAPPQPLVAPAFTLADLERCEADLAAFDHALALLDDGRFALCDLCGAPIELELLRVELLERRCAAHQGQVPLPFQP